MVVERLRKTIDSKDPYKCQRGKELDSKSLETFLKESLWTTGAYKLLEIVLRTDTGLDPSQMSTLSFLDGVASAGGLDNLLGMEENQAQGLKVKGGTQQISQIMAKKIGLENVLLEHPVDEIIQQEKCVKLRCRNGLTVSCKRAVIAAPPTATRKISFVPQLSRERRECEKSTIMGNITKVIITYKEAFWRLRGQSGEAMTYGGPSNVAGCDVGPLSGVMDATTPTGNPALVTFIAGGHAIQWSKQSAEVRKGAVLKSLVDFFGFDAENCLDYIEYDWSSERFIEGALAGVGTGGMKYSASGLREPQGRLHFAGTESATEWDGFMSGGIQAGIRAATEVLYHIRPGAVSQRNCREPTTAQHLNH